MNIKQAAGYSIALIGVITFIIWIVNVFVQPILPEAYNNQFILVIGIFLAVTGFISTFKDTLELIHILLHPTSNEPSPATPANVTTFRGHTSAQFIVTGGTNININLPNNSAIDNRIVASQSMPEQVKLFIEALGVNQPKNDFISRKRYEVYSNVWRKLVTLKAAGDSLWNRPTQINLRYFESLLQTVEQQVEVNAILFNTDDFNDLLTLFMALRTFKIGKGQITTMKSKAIYNFRKSIREQSQRQIRKQALTNRRYREQYELLLQKVLSSFQQRLS